MIFRRISYILAAQFTGVVFMILLVTGALFIAGDIAQRSRDAHVRLQQQMTTISNQPGGARSIPSLPSFQRERIRITDALGKPIYAGALFRDIPFVRRAGFSTIESGEELYDILTAPVVDDGDVIGYIQVADRAPYNDLEPRVFLFLLVSAAISAGAFAVGLTFARRSLRPAEQMMDRLEQFTQDASHELRTPLTSVSTSLDLAIASGSQEHVKAAKKGLKEVAVLVERLLDLARLDSFILKKEPTDASALVASVLDAHADIAKERGVTIERHLGANLKLAADAMLLKQVVMNLTNNAIKFNKPGGSVTVTLTKDALTVKDTGNGISAQSLPHIFDRFYRDDKARTKQTDGLGLGLALVKRIVDLHGWKIAVASEEGKGATFTVKF